jgi:ketosteroid isomerase-like protein
MEVELELREQEQVLAPALEGRDVDALSRLLAPDYVFTSAQGETWRRDRAMADFADPRLRVGHIRVDVDRVIALGEAGLVTGRSEVEGNIGKHSLSGVFRFTHVWRRSGGPWQIVAGHTSSVITAGNF